MLSALLFVLTRWVADVEKREVMKAVANVLPRNFIIPEVQQRDVTNPWVEMLGNVTFFEFMGVAIKITGCFMVFPEKHVPTNISLH